MSQIEALMLVALGFLLALMLVLAFGRSIWSAANLYARRRREKDLPAAMLELQAERDRLRADNARMMRKLEVGTEEMSAKVVAQMAEVSRHRDRLLAMAGQAVKADEDLSHLSSENGDLVRQIADLKRELDAQDQVINQLRQELAKLSSAKPALADVVMTPPANENPRTSTLAEPQDLGSISPDTETEVSAPQSPAMGPAMGRAMAASEKAGRASRFNFDRKPLSPSMERTMGPSRRTELLDVIEEARRSLTEEVNSASDSKAPSAADPVLGFAQRIREIQKKNDARLNKTLK